MISADIAGRDSTDETTAYAIKSSPHKHLMLIASDPNLLNYGLHRTTGDELEMVILSNQIPALNTENCS